MVAEVQNCTIQVLRGTALDAFGDILDASVPIFSGVPASVIETNRTVFDQATRTPLTVRTSTCIVPAWLGVLNSDQILNERTGDRYIVESVETPPTTTGAPVDTRLGLRRITGTGP